MALATIADLMDLTGNSYSDDEIWRLTSLLGVASREIQKFTGQKLERMVHTWKPFYSSWLTVPQMPNVAITSVKDGNGNDVTYQFDDVDTIWLNNGYPIRLDLELGIPTTRLVIVYTAGYEFIPDDLKAICCQMALRTFGSDPLNSGKTQESITNYSYQQGQAAAAGAIGMLPMEQSSLLAYRRPRGPIRMTRFI